MAKIQWDQTGERIYETGTKQGVLYPYNTVTNAYDKGYGWNGLTGVTESPTGAEVTPIYADDIKYVNIVSAEEFGFTIEAYTYPDEFGECDGTAELVSGVSIGQQTRKTFGFSYVTSVGNDTEGVDHGYKIHLIYGALASPSEKSRTTINDSPEGVTFSWECSTTAVQVPGFKPTAKVEIDSRTVDADLLKAFEDIIYGTEAKEARLPLPEEVKTLFTA